MKMSHVVLEHYALECRGLHRTFGSDCISRKRATSCSRSMPTTYPFSITGACSMPRRTISSNAVARSSLGVKLAHFSRGRRDVAGGRLVPHRPRHLAHVLDAHEAEELASAQDGEHALLA